MDPAANLSEQIEIALEVIAVSDREEPDERRLIVLGERLAELVVALHEWRCTGGFDPYAR